MSFIFSIPGARKRAQRCKARGCPSSCGVRKRGKLGSSRSAGWPHLLQDSWSMPGYILEPKGPAFQVQGGWRNCDLTPMNREIPLFRFFPISFPLQIRNFRACKLVEILLRHPLRTSTHSRAFPAAAGPPFCTVLTDLG